MYRLLMMMLILAFSGMVLAQSDALNCPTQDNHAVQMTIDFPELSGETSDQFIVSVLGVEGFQPVIEIAAENQSYCNYGVDQGSFYGGSLPEIGNLNDIRNSVQDFVGIPGQNQINFGEIFNQSGQFLVMIESRFDDFSMDGHTYTISFPDELLSGANPLDAYLFTITPELAPKLTVDLADDNIVEAEPIDGTIDLLTTFGSPEAGSFIEIDATDTVTLTVEKQNDGAYLLVLVADTGKTLVGEGAAKATENDDGSWAVDCADEPAFESGIRFDLPEDRAFTVTAVGVAPFDPVLAVIDENGDGFCFDDTPAALLYSAALPSIEMFPVPSSAQAIVDGSARTIIVGSRDDEAGEFVLFIEGGQLEEDSEGAEFRLQVPGYVFDVPEGLIAYLFTVDADFDPKLEVLDDAGEVALDEEEALISCDNAGFEEACYGQSQSLVGFGIIGQNNTPLPGIEVNPMLSIPPMEAEEDSSAIHIPLRASSVEGQAGAYTLLFDVILTNGDSEGE